MRFICLSGILLHIVATAAAQSTSTNTSDYPVVKQYNSWLVQFNPRMDLLLKDNRNVLYLEGLINSKHEYGSLIENYRWNLKMGIDHAASATWGIGFSQRINSNSSGVFNYCTRVYAQHRGNIGRALFMQEFIYDHFLFAGETQSNTTSSGTTLSKRPAEGRIGLGAGLGRYFKAGENKLAIFSSYRMFIQFDYVNDNASYYRDRYIDYTQLRVDIGYLIMDSYYIGLYGTRDTNFSISPSQDPYKRNSITPIMGIAFNFIIRADSQAEKETAAFRYFYTK